MRDYSGIVRSILISMMLVGAIVLFILGIIWHNDAQDSIAQQSFEEFVQETGEWISETASRTGS